MVKQKQIKPIEPEVGMPKTIVMTSTSSFTKMLQEIFYKRTCWHLRDTLLLTRGKLKDFTGVEIGLMTKYIRYIDNLKNGDIDLIVVQLSHPNSENNDTFVWKYWRYR